MNNTNKILAVSAHTTVGHNLLLENSDFVDLVANNATVNDLIEFVEKNY